MNSERLDMLKRLQPFFREKMGKCDELDMVYCLEHNQYESWLYWEEKDVILVPDVYSRDPERPERGLWGMVDWDIDIYVARTGRVSIHRITEGCEPLDIALLKMLCHQEGI